ncbi:hypothetical protein BC833DRAFT_569684 [Globomyces pollinis-pini]|nr:hypothetical protein BC833DRAFT_569684 [Globomyces pollinis-pini]
MNIKVISLKATMSNDAAINRLNQFSTSVTCYQYLAPTNLCYIPQLQLSHFLLISLCFDITISVEYTCLRVNKSFRLKSTKDIHDFSPILFIGFSPILLLLKNLLNLKSTYESRTNQISFDILMSDLRTIELFLVMTNVVFFMYNVIALILSYKLFINLISNFFKGIVFIALFICKSLVRRCCSKVTVCNGNGFGFSTLVDNIRISRYSLLIEDVSEKLWSYIVLQVFLFGKWNRNLINCYYSKENSFKCWNFGMAICFQMSAMIQVILLSNAYLERIKNNLGTNRLRGLTCLPNNQGGSKKYRLDQNSQ